MLDKSVLKELTSSELESLGLRYLVVVPPVLLMEIGGGDEQKSLIGKLFNLKSQNALKFSGYEHADYKRILEASLFGREIAGAFSPAIVEAQPAAGLAGALSYTLTPKDDELKHWDANKLSPVEQQSAEVWKQSSLENFAKLKEKLTSIPLLANLSSFETVAKEMGTIFKTQAGGFNSIEWLCKRVDMSSENLEIVQERWLKNMRPFHEFSPYAFYCFLVEQAFFQSLANGLVVKTAPIEAYRKLEYAYYFPFVRTFATSDNFLQSIWAAFANQNEQKLITGKELKAELSSL